MDEFERDFGLPGFRFHPTEEELLDFYLKNMIFSKNSRVEVIGFLNIYRHDPWELPGLSRIGEREWYFFVPRDRKQGSGGRPNRTTQRGFWKATGSDRKIVSLSEPKRIIGLKKTLVFYQGRAPRGSKTDWVMNEYRLPDGFRLPKDIVLCKIYRKATSLKTLEQRAAQEEVHASRSTSPLSSEVFQTTILYDGFEVEEYARMGGSQILPKEESEGTIFLESLVNKTEEVDENEGTEKKDAQILPEQKINSIKLPFCRDNLPELQLSELDMEREWAQDPFLSISPWLQILTPSSNILNF